MEGIFEAEFIGRFFDKALISLKASRRFRHLELKQILVGTLAVEPLEKPAQVGFVHTTGFGNLIQGTKSQAVLSDELPAGLVCRESACVERCFRGSRFSGSEHDQLDQGRTYPRPVAPCVDPGCNQVIEKVQDNVGRSDLCDGSGGQTEVTKEPMSLSTGEVHEVFDERIARLSGNVMRDSRTIGEDRSGRERDGSVPDRQETFASRDEFQGMEGKIRPIDLVVGSAMLETATNDNKRLTTVVIRVQIEPVGLEHLVREEVRHASGELDFAHHRNGQ